MSFFRRIFALERNILVLSFTVFLFIIPLNAWYVVLPLYLEKLGATTINIGITYALLNIAWYGLQFPGGLLADRYGRKMLIVLPTFTFFVCYLVAGSALMWSVAALAIIASNIFSGLQSPAFTSTIAESVNEQRRGTAFATFGFFVNLALAIGPLIGAALIPLYGYSSLFYATAITSVFCGLFRLVFLHETREKTSDEETRLVFPKVNKNLTWFFVGCSLFAMAYGLVLPLMALYAHRKIGLLFSEVELMFAVAQFATCLSSVPSGKIIEKAGDKPCLMVAFLGTCLTMTAWAYSPSLWVSIILMASSYVFFTLFWIGYDSLISRLTVPQTRGAIIGIAAVIVGIFTGAGSAAGSYLWESYAPVLPFIIGGVLSIPATICLSFVKDES